MKNRLTTAYILSIISVIPILFMSISPLLSETIYQILNFIYILFRGMNDYKYYQYPINIAVLIIFTFSLIYAFRGSYRGRLIWLGCVFYFLYIQMVFFVDNMLFYTYDHNIEVLPRDIFSINNAFIVPLALLFFVFIIGMLSSKSIEVKNSVSYNKLTSITTIIFLAYLVIIFSHLILLIRIEVLLLTYNAESMHLGGQDIINLIILIPCFIFIVIILNKKQKIGAIFTPIALFPITIPILNDELIHSFGLNISKMIINPIRYIYYCLFLDIDEYIVGYMNDDPKKDIVSIYQGTDNFLDEIRLIFLICGIVLIVLFLKNIKENPKRKESI